MPPLRPSQEVLEIVEALSPEETKLMRVLARVVKSDTVRIFDEQDLLRKKTLRNMDVAAVLHGLVPKHLVVPVGRGRWQTTSLGGQVEHYLEDRWIREKWGFSSERR